MVDPLGLILVLELKIILQSIVVVGLLGLVILGAYIILLLVFNSIILQFSSIVPRTSERKSIVFPLSYTTHVAAFSCPHYNTDKSYFTCSEYPYDVTLTGFKIEYIPGRPLDCFAIGY